MAGCAGGLHRSAGRAAIKGKSMPECYCKGERFADLSFAGEVFDSINLLTW